MRLLLRFVVFLFLFLIARSILRSLFAPARSNPAPPSGARQPPTVSAGGELKKDPVCGTYVSINASITQKVNGEVLHFCSPECRDKYKYAR